MKICRENSSSIKIGQKTVTLLEEQYTFMIISRSFLLRMRNVSDKRCRDNKTRILYSVTFFLKVMNFLDNVENNCRAGRTNMTSRTHIACLIH